MLARTLFFWDFFLQIPLWSLNIEMGCSLVFPLLYWVFNQMSVKGHLLLLLILAAVIFIVPMPPYDLRVEFLRYLVLFHAGLLCGAYGTQFMEALGGCRRTIFWISAAAFGIIAQLWMFASTHVLFDDRRWVLLFEVPFCFILLSYVIHGSGTASTALLRTPWARFLGKISYSLFLFHYPIVNIISFYVLRNMSPSVAAFNQHWPLIIQMCFFLAVLVVSIAISTVSYYWIEKPSIRLGRKFQLKSQKNPWNGLVTGNKSLWGNTE